MSDMHLQNKLRKITEAAKNGEHIPERPKKVGMLIFFIISAIGLLGLAALAIALAVYGHRLSGLIIFLIAISLMYALYKLISAENIHSL